MAVMMCEFRGLESLRLTWGLKMSNMENHTLNTHAVRLVLKEVRIAFKVRNSLVSRVQGQKLSKSEGSRFYKAPILERFKVLRSFSSYVKLQI